MQIHYTRIAHSIILLACIFTKIEKIDTYFIKGIHGSERLD